MYCRIYIKYIRSWCLAMHNYIVVFGKQLLYVVFSCFVILIVDICLLYLGQYYAFSHIGFPTNKIRLPRASATGNSQRQFQLWFLLYVLLVLLLIVIFLLSLTTMVLELYDGKKRSMVGVSELVNSVTVLSLASVLSKFVMFSLNTTLVTVL